METVHHDAMENDFQRASRYLVLFPPCSGGQGGQWTPLEGSTEISYSVAPWGDWQSLHSPAWSLSPEESLKPVALDKVIHSLGISDYFFKLEDWTYWGPGPLQRASIETGKQIAFMFLTLNGCVDLSKFIHISASVALFTNWKLNLLH